MKKQTYKNQVALLIRIIPEIEKEACFALHGGTAINLFIRDMPRLSVDIDLTYVPLEDRETSLARINAALERIKATVERTTPGIRVDHKKEVNKMMIGVPDALIKIEVNTIMRGTLGEPLKKELCGKAQSEFDAFCAINVVSLGQLYGGKICAALDRQHPRDLFDVKYLLNNEGFNDEIKEGFLLRLLGGERPIHEVLFPGFQDQQSALENQFEGMSEEPFSYEEYEATRRKMVEVIHKSLTDADKKFILSVKDETPGWHIHDFERFPSIQWKLHNIRTLKERNPGKHQEQYNILRDRLQQ